MSIEIDSIDHVVLTCRDVEATAAWYEQVLGMKRQVFGSEQRVALMFGSQKINVRPAGAESWETSNVEAPGSLDLCFITRSEPSDVIDHFKACGVTLLTGPVVRSGALGPITSVYCNDLDGNLVEVASYARPPEPTP